MPSDTLEYGTPGTAGKREAVKTPYALEVLRVWIVGEDPLARQGLSLLLAGHEDLQIVGQSAPEDGAALVEEALPDVALWDLGSGSGTLPDRLGGLSVPVVFLLSEEARVQEALGAGAQGALLRDVEAPRLAAALRAASEGLFVLDETFSHAIVPSHPEAPPRLPEELTPRETEVIQLLAQGLSNRRIAERLGISEHTAKFHVNAILGKLGAETRTEAVVLAARLGLVLL